MFVRKKSVSVLTRRAKSALTFPQLTFSKDFHPGCTGWKNFSRMLEYTLADPRTLVRVVVDRVPKSAR